MVVAGTFQMCLGGMDNGGSGHFSDVFWSKANDFHRWIEHKVESEISNSDAEWL